MRLGTKKCRDEEVVEGIEDLLKQRLINKGSPEAGRQAKGVEAVRQKSSKNTQKTEDWGI